MESAKPLPDSNDGAATANPFWVNAVRQYWPELLAILIPLIYTVALLEPARHLPAGTQFLGFPQFDQVVYYACAREYFENGTGLTYASPYSSSADSPAIYSHLVFLIFGYTWKLTGLSFTFIDYFYRAFGGMIFLLLAVRIFRVALPSHRLLPFALLLLLFGGGIAWLTAILNLCSAWLSVPSPRPGFAETIALCPSVFASAEGGYGEWHLNLSRNLIFTPEVMYHCFSFGGILCALKQRHSWALLFSAFTWWSHPFNGLELGSMMMLFLLVETWFHRSLWKIAIAQIAINGLFLSYYFFFLGSFPEHASVADFLSDYGNPMLFRMLPSAYGFMLVLCPIYLFTSHARKRLQNELPHRFMLCWLITVLGLVFHDRILFFIRPHMPMHFTRGYLYVPLVYFSVCLLQDVLPRIRSRRIQLWLLTGILLLHFPDNLLHLSALRKRLPVSEQSYSMPPTTAHAIALLTEIEEPSTVFSGSADRFPNLDYYIALCTHHRPLMGHHLNTPYLREKQSRASELSPDPTAEKFAELELDLLVLSEPAFEYIKQHLAPDQYLLRKQDFGVYIVELILPSETD